MKNPIAPACTHDARFLHANFPLKMHGPQRCWVPVDARTGCICGTHLHASTAPKSVFMPIKALACASTSRLRHQPQCTTSPGVPRAALQGLPPTSQQHCRVGGVVHYTLLPCHPAAVSVPGQRQAHPQSRALLHQSASFLDVVNHHVDGPRCRCFRHCIICGHHSVQQATHENVSFRYPIALTLCHYAVTAVS